MIYIRANVLSTSRKNGSHPLSSPTPSVARSSKLSIFKKNYRQFWTQSKRRDLFKLVAVDPKMKISNFLLSRSYSFYWLDFRYISPGANNHIFSSTVSRFFSLPPKSGIYPFKELERGRGGWEGVGVVGPTCCLLTTWWWNGFKRGEPLPVDTVSLNS